tara:strand:- start:1342 stop:1653 length:312 start_codon:yes stop_codon:yes gene_type:complete
MGQYGNQPDFITYDIAAVTPVAANAITPAASLNGSIVYVGTSTDNGQDIQVIPVGATGTNGSGLPGLAQAITFKNVQQGEWFPVVVDYVLSNATTATDLISGK